MDGNGRWARARGLPRSMGHRRGVEAVREAVRAAGEFGIDYLTLFAFSSENWRRPKDEVDELLGLLRHFIRRDLADLHKEGVRVRVIGATTARTVRTIGSLMPPVWRRQSRACAVVDAQAWVGIAGRGRRARVMTRLSYALPGHWMTSRSAKPQYR